MASFETEREGQVEFFRTFLPAVDPTLGLEDIISDNNDGVLNGNLLEFKCRVSDLNSHLFQCVKYLSARRMKGKPVPANILIVDLNAERAYLYKSADYLADIEKVYTGAASRNNQGFIGSHAEEKYEYGKNQSDAAALIGVLRSKGYTRIHIDENCVVGWATAFYRAVPNARKEDFIGDETGKHKTVGEIRKPSVFARFIHPYTGKTNIRFRYLMDRLNDTLQKKNLGAFYTPEPYAEKSRELLRTAIARVPKGNDYVIIDRCAGTGNLERGLTDDELSHCILSTVEYYEYKVLQEALGSKVRHVIPPIEAKDTFNAGLVRGADALSEEFLGNPVIESYVHDENCTIILFENPPYSESTSIEHQRKGAGGKSSVWKSSHVAQEMRKEVRGTALNDLGNAFIWSAFKYYLRQDTDSYVVYSPVKYWKAQHLVNKRFVSGYAFNRRHFHTKIDACVMCALWTNEQADLDRIELEAFDIDKNGLVVGCGTLPVSRVYSMFSRKYYDKRSFPDDEPGIIAEFDGTESTRKPQGISPVFNPNILGYLAVKGNNFDNPDSSVHLLRVGEYDGHGFYLRRDEYLSKLPMFCASRYVSYNRQWTERARIMKSGDGAERFGRDVDSGKLSEWLRKCLLFTCVEMQNHVRTFLGSDGRFYRNELCLDTTKGQTIASEDLDELIIGVAEKAILDQWEILLNATKLTKEYNPSFTYGVYQIFSEIDTSYKDDDGEVVWNNVEVHSALQTLRKLVKDYYNSEIVPMLFEYEFLK